MGGGRHKVCRGPHRADASLLSGFLVERQIFLCQCFFVSSPRRRTRLELPRPAVAAWLSPLAANIALILLQRGSKARPGGGCEDGFRFEMGLTESEVTGHYLDRLYGES